MKSDICRLSVAAFLATCAFAFASAAEPETSQKLDEARVMAQGICPVTGADLNSIGGPVEAKSGEQSIYLCCKECMGEPISPEHWATIGKNLAAAQGRCPVMNRALPAGASSTVVDGRRVFVCCPPCIKKIQASPEKYLALVDAAVLANAARP